MKHLVPTFDEDRHLLVSCAGRRLSRQGGAAARLGDVCTGEAGAGGDGHGSTSISTQHRNSTQRATEIRSGAARRAANRARNGRSGHARE
eukprot:2451989-Prymnesium_polylepis.1